MANLYLYPNQSKAKSTSSSIERQRWLRDLETLRRRAAAAQLQAAELSKNRLGEELTDAQARLESLDHRRTAVESEVDFTESALTKIRARLSD